MGSTTQYKYTASKTQPSLPRTQPHGHLPFISRLPKAPLLWQSLSSLCFFGKGPDVAVRKKHSGFSWSDF